MRDIKFRAWDKNRKLMRNVWSIDYKAGKDFIMVQMPDAQFMPRSADWGNTKEHIILMQYTGLKDKNGKDIYEGDVIKWVYNDEGSDGMPIRNENIFEVKWSNKWQGFNTLEYPQDSYTEFEIIGNIYEDGDLLK